MPKGYYASRALRSVILPIGPSIAYVPLTKGLFALIDSEDADKFQNHLWFAAWRKSTQSFYAQRNKALGDGKYLMEMLHNVVLPPHGEFMVDHIFGVTLDNRKSQLRLVTRSQQNINRRKNRNNSTGYTGVSRRESGKFRAYMMFQRKLMNLGDYDELEQAISVRKAAEDKYFGEFARR